jgi:hypothetical protein
VDARVVTANYDAGRAVVLVMAAIAVITISVQFLLPLLLNIDPLTNINTSIFTTAAAAEVATIVRFLSINMGVKHEMWTFAAKGDDIPLVLLDNACTGHISGHPSMLTKITTTFPVVVRGANGVSTTCSAGTLSLIDAVFQILPGAPTLLSQSKMRKDYHIYLISGSKANVLQHKRKERTLIFWLYKDVYPLVCVIDDGKLTYERTDVVRHAGGIERVLEAAEGHPSVDAFAQERRARSHPRARGTHRRAAAGHSHPRARGIDRRAAAGRLGRCWY